MGRKLDELKELAAKICEPGTVVTGNTVDEILDCIGKHIALGGGNSGGNSGGATVKIIRFMPNNQYDIQAGGNQEIGISVNDLINGGIDPTKIVNVYMSGANAFCYLVYMDEYSVNLYVDNKGTDVIYTPTFNFIVIE